MSFVYKSITNSFTTEIRFKLFYYMNALKMEFRQLLGINVSVTETIYRIAVVTMLTSMLLDFCRG